MTGGAANTSWKRIVRKFDLRHASLLDHPVFNLQRLDRSLSYGRYFDLVLVGCAILDANRDTFCH